jgi:hypothetical protein
MVEEAAHFFSAPASEIASLARLVVDWSSDNPQSRETGIYAKALNFDL